MFFSTPRRRRPKLDPVGVRLAPVVRTGALADRRVRKLEIAVGLVLVALLCGVLASRFRGEVDEVRVARVRETAAAMRSLAREIHLQTLMAGTPDFTGSWPSAYGTVDLAHGQPTAGANGIGRLIAADIDTRRMRCVRSSAVDPSNAQAVTDRFECGPAELPISSRRRCGARYMGARRAGAEPVVTVELQAANPGPPCALE